MRTWLMTGLILLLGITAVYGQYADTLRLHNPAFDITALINNPDGRFTEGTNSPRRPLLYGFPPPYRTVPWSSHFNLRVDGTTVTNADDVQISTAPVRWLTQITPDRGYEPRLLGDSLARCRYSYGGVECWQILKPTSLGPGSNTLFIQYKIYNTDSRAHSVGILLELDTQINGRDESPISTASGYVAREQEFYAPNIPTYWQAFEESPFQDPSLLVGQGTLIGGEATMPDRFCLGPKRVPGSTRDNYGDVVWDYDTIGGPYNDSGVLLWWYPLTLQPGDSMVVGTYYGTGQPQLVDGMLPMLVAFPSPLWCSQCEISPNPFDVNLVLTYNRPALLPIFRVTGLTATITLGAGLLLETPSTRTQSLNPTAINADDIATVSWRVMADGSATGDLSFDIDVRCDQPLVDANRGTWHVQVPAGCSAMLPHATLTVPDSCDTFYCCPYLAPNWRFTSTVGLQETTLQVRVNSTTIGYGDIRLSWSAPNLTYIPPTAWSSGDRVSVSLLRALNELGCNLIPTTCSFTIDLVPPSVTASAFTGDTTLAVPTPLIWVDLTDALSGVDSTSLEMTLDGVSMRVGQPGVTWNRTSGRFQYNPVAAGRSFADGDTVRVCLTSAFDRSRALPSLGCNRIPVTGLPACVTLRFDLQGPQGEVLCPPPNSYSSCTNQRVIVNMTDANGVADTSVTLWVDGVAHRFGVDPQLAFDGALMTWSPPPGTFATHDTVRIRISARDRLGNRSDTLVSFRFYVDHRPPRLEDPQPPDLASVATLAPAISAYLHDELAGLRFSSIRMTIRTSVGTRDLTWGDPALSYAGDRLSVDWARLGLAIAGGETVAVCIRASDSTALTCLGQDCPDNADSLCWSFTVGGEGPVAALIRPRYGSIVACPQAEVVFRVTDPNGLLAESLITEMNGSTVRYGDAGLSLANDSLRYLPPTPWPDQDTIRVALIAARDSLLNPLGAPVRSWFIADRTGPAIGFGDPFGLVIEDPQPELHFSLRDRFTIVPPESIRVTIDGGTPLSVDGTAVTFEGESLLVRPTLLGLRFRGGDTVRVCVHAVDRPDTCGPNPSDSCATFAVSAAGPTASLQYPPWLAITSCSNQSVRFLVSDRNGVDPSAFLVRADGVDYPWGSSALTWDGTVLIWSPSAGTFTHAETARVVLATASDSLGNPLADSVIARFVVDLLPPVLDNVSPPTGAVVATRAPNLTLTAVDVPASVNRDSLRLLVGGLTLDLSDPALTLVGDTLRLDGAAAGLHFRGGDTVRVRLIAFDHPTLRDCPPHGDTLETWFTIATGGPTARIVYPPESLVSACARQGAIIAVHDSHGVDITTLRVLINGLELPWPTTMLSWDGESLLTFTPSMNWLHAETVTVFLLDVEDVLGNSLRDSNVVVSFRLDLLPPTATMILPVSGTVIHTPPEPEIRWLWSDDFTGVNADSVRLEVQDIVYQPGSAGLQILGDTIQFLPEEAGVSFPEGDTVRVCLSGLRDRPDLCTPNAADRVCDSFFIYERLPNLHLYSLTCTPPEPQEGNKGTISGMVENSGEKAALAFTLRMFVHDSTWSTLSLPALAIGDRVAFSDSAMMTTRWDSVCAVSDPENLIRESDEGDNRECLTVHIKPSPCREFPDPITPDGNGMNDQTTIWFADWSLGTAQIHIYSDQNRLVRALPPGERAWDGRDDDRSAVPGGVYLYVVTDGGSTICTGTITVVR